MKRYLFRPYSKRCGYHLIYLDPVDALKAMESMQKDGLDRKNEPLSIFKCRRCKFYHVGHLRLKTQEWK